jgi:hypothetical protein
LTAASAELSACLFEAPRGARARRACKGFLNSRSVRAAFASSDSKLPDWIDGQVRGAQLLRRVTKAIRLRQPGVAKALWFAPTLNATVATMTEHYDTAILIAGKRTKGRFNLPTTAIKCAPGNGAANRIEHRNRLPAD